MPNFGGPIADRKVKRHIPLDNEICRQSEVEEVILGPRPLESSNRVEWESNTYYDLDGESTAAVRSSSKSSKVRVAKGE